VLKKQDSTGLPPAAERAMRWVFGVFLSAATLLFLASIGGGMVFVWWALVPLHWWMARESGPIGAGWWAFLAGASVGEVAWMAAYVLTGHEAVTVVVGVVVMVGTATAFLVARSRRVTTE
jgi:hypothetical protein